MLAGMSYVQKSYDPSTSLRAGRPGNLTALAFINAYRDALFASGWKLIDVTKLVETPTQPETVNVSARYQEHGRNIYARLTQEPGGAYQINVADLGAENWPALLAADCGVRIHSLHFDLDRASLGLEATRRCRRPLTC